MEKIIENINTQKKSLIHLFCILFLIICLPVPVQAAEIAVQSDAEILGGGGFSIT